MKTRTIIVGKKELDALVLERLTRRFNELVKKDRTKEITFLFDVCPGGDINGVLKLIAHIEASGVPIRTKGKGKIDSAAALLFLVGKKREGERAFEFFLHPFDGTPSGFRYWYIEEDYAKSRAK